MGQRLNIEIVNKDNKILANAYYHWGGYTSSAIDLTRELIECWEPEYRERANNDVLYAIRLLEGTGAGLTPDEVHYYEENINEKLLYKECVDRSRGIISISPEGIEETESLEEARVIINLDTELINFMAVFSYEKEYLLEEFEENNVDITSYNIVKCPFNFSQMDIEDFYYFMSIYEWNKRNIYLDTTDFYCLPIE